METDSHASDIGHWLGMTPLRGVRGDAPQGYLLRCVGIAPYGRVTRVRWFGRTESSAPTKGTRGGAAVKRREGQSPSPTHVYRGMSVQRLSLRHEARLLIAVFGKQGGGFLAVGPGVLADVLNGGLIQPALDPGG